MESDIERCTEREIHRERHRNIEIGFGKRGLLEKGSFQKDRFSRDSRDFRESRDSREPPDWKTNENRTVFWKILENVEF